ncbi:MAG: TatD family hydrolase [Oligoflexales bacterium]|nr:TatD family hydrolase [Oligoflexales bacterium]
MSENVHALNYVDVHTHLTHKDFDADRDLVVDRAAKSQLKAIIVNGLSASSNKQVIELCQKHSILKPALGVYPTEAAAAVLPPDYPYSLERFDMEAELQSIREHAKNGDLVAIGECGLDGHLLGESTFAEQERVFLRLIEIASEFKLPVIVHSRKREQRTCEILLHHGIEKVNMHCFTGKTKLAVDVATSRQWCFSIPAHIARSHSFQKLSRDLPPDCILTETDAPYLGPDPGQRNEPASVVRTVDSIAKLRKTEPEDMVLLIWKNYQRMFDNHE